MAAMKHYRVPKMPARIRTSRRRPSPGFTMPELVVAMAITALLTAIAVPSFSGLTASQRAKTVSSELFESLLRTRSEAIVRNANVTIAPIGSAWVSGWQVLDPANAANVLDTRGAESGVTIIGPAAVTYEPSGRLPAGTAPRFLVTAAAGSTTVYQCLSIDLSGRPYIVAAATC